MKCGLLGRKLGHSYSPQIHAHLGDYSYALFEKEPEQLADFLKYGDYSGINVTVPYKKGVIPYLDELTPKAEKLGAVNTILRKNGTLIGHNTDYYGFYTMLTASGLEVAGKKVLVLGSGGSSNTVTAVLRAQGANPVVISRKGPDHYDNLDRHSDAALIVNTTPVGMYPQNGISPLSLDHFPKLEGVLDLIYNPARTQLLLEAEKRGLVTANGLLMLVAQAKESAECFLGHPLPENLIPQVHKKLQASMENLILIGMPGSGKTTIGKLLAQSLQLKFLDADSVLESDCSRRIPDIFAQDGETYFRKLETQTLAALGMRSGIILATGGGCVTKPENYPLLHQNGTIVWLQRDLSLLPTDGRPLSQANRLQDLWQAREPLYRNFADIIVDNNGAAEQTVAEILKRIGRQL